ncbi:MAG: rhomboid family intramembrane serine protease [Opitutales bacterium]
MAMKPIRLSYNAPFTLTFTVACVVVLLLNTVTRYGASAVLFSVGDEMNLLNPLSYLRLFLHVLGHASPTHLAYNLMILLLIGPMLEEKHGWKKLTLVTAVTALATALPMLVLPGTLMGASGVVFACIILASYTRVTTGAVPITFALVCLLFLGREIYVGFATSDSVAQFAHILGGAIGGYFAIRWKR